MRRGGELLLAAQLLSGPLLPVVSPAQPPTRTRDLGFATVRYENGLTLGAMTLYETLALRREQSAVELFGLASLFNDGSWSLQGGLEGARRSLPVPTGAAFRGFFRSMRGEVAISAGSTAQAGVMPTLQISGHARVLLEHDGRGGRVGATIARGFDGYYWQTTVIGEASGWVRRGAAVFALTARPMQLDVGDMLGDTQFDAEWVRGPLILGASSGIRLGEAQRGTIGWGSLAATFPVRDDIWLTTSLGSYPADLIQGLPGGRFVAVTMRLPGGRFPPLHRPPPAPPPPRRPPALPVTERLALVIGFALDSADLREIRVWAPGVRRVELMADFVDWIPVPLIRQPGGEWVGYYRVRPGLHRLNLRLDGEEIDVPTNLSIVQDEFLGKVGLIVVR